MQAGFDFLKMMSAYYNSRQIELLQNMKIGIAGAGGIGSNCALLLTRSGVQHFTIADFDRVCASNLNRQAFSAAHIGRMKVECLKEVCIAINPDVSIVTCPVRIDRSLIHSLFDGCDIIIEAFDCAASKALLFEEYIHSGKLLVGASGIAGIGNTAAIVVRKLHKNCFIVGDETSAVSEILKPYAPRVMVAAAKMADIVLDWIINRN
jgi:sulfur carrier protein ThiS adenylyltransferase